MTDKNHGRGGVYFQATPDSEPVRVCGTDHPLSDQEQKSLDSARAAARRGPDMADTPDSSAPEETQAKPAKTGDRR